MIKIKKPRNKEEWLKIRQFSIGGSEVAAILGLDHYKSSIELFYEKLGLTERKEENILMFMGTYLEEKIANLWQYVELDEGEVDEKRMIENFYNKKKIRKCKNLNFILYSDEYPFLSANIDRIILKKGNPGVLEIKTISGFASQQWEAEIPPSYYIQLQHYLLVTGWKWGEIFLLKDGRKLKLYTFERNEKVINQIVSKTSEFWAKLKLAKEVLNNGGKEQDIYKFEPSPDGSLAYEKFLNQKYLKTDRSIEGNMEELDKCIEHKKLSKEISILEDKQREISNLLKSKMIKEGVNKIDFGGNGYVSWNEDTRGIKKLFIKI